MKTMIMRAAVALTAGLALATLSTTAHAEGPERAPVLFQLQVGVSALQLATEDRTGYKRTSFKHWNAGANPSDGCNTRQEVLIAEAVELAAIGPGCTLTGGTWLSYYDDRLVTPAGSLDIDHVVPLAEAWDSGASSWTAARREAYANDLGQGTSLVAVTAKSNRSKADQDPAEWLPTSPQAWCRYGAEWTATKLRWGLAVDEAERAQLLEIAAGCKETIASFTPAP
ncbi:HNH endonuclease family protein [Streptomyces chengbuensis]|uniref:HNH endonuclease family protein n=1 Tax=Streptomyces chengbuensis TaxID=3053466 RepID=UPI0025B4C6D6|nr:HNH endonuclease family protein [Streptomyces sp. HUAS CB01]WJY53569.1 HNH endonuclease family protein [Streptomyces sp. HUAS CB01]